MKTVEFFKILLQEGSIESLKKHYPSVTDEEIHSHFQCVFDKCSDNSEIDNIYELYTDGAARGNPGSAGVGFVIKKNGYTIEKASKYIGKATNNIAEYTALIEGLKRLKELEISKVKVFSDSELMVKQINGEYAVKNSELKKLHDTVNSLIASFDEFSIKHIPREQNKEADQLSKQGSKG